MAFSIFQSFGIESFVKGPQETQPGLLCSLNTNWSLSHFIQGIGELGESGEINWRVTAASVKTQVGRLFNQGVEHSIPGKIQENIAHF